MRRFLGLLPLAVAILSSCTKTDAAGAPDGSATPPPPGAPKAEKPMTPPNSVNIKAAVKAAEAANAFGLDLFRTVAQEKPGENLFISPTSLSLALGMAYSGSGGGTSVAMAKTLHLTGDIAAADSANAALQATLLGADPKVTVSIANAIWADKSVTFRADYAARCRTNYGASAVSLPLADPASADRINSWCAQATNSLITQLVTPDDLKATVGVLTNAVYVKGIWTVKFDKSRTTDQPFHPEGMAEYTVPMMHLEKEFEYRGPTPDGHAPVPTRPGKPTTVPTDDGPQIVRLPYGSGEWAMYAFLPKKGTELSALVSELTDANWRKWRSEFRPATVRLSLPRFKAEFERSMVRPLEKLGMGEAFSDRADFASMFDQPGGYYISNVIHKAVLKVNEESTEAAAATGVLIERAAMRIPPPTVEMTFDRPFVCAIVHEQTGAIAFLGAFPHPDINRD